MDRLLTYFVHEIADATDLSKPIKTVSSCNNNLSLIYFDVDWLSPGHKVKLRHMSYNLTKAVERIRNTTYPQAQDFAEHDVLQPPSEGERLKYSPARIEVEAITGHQSAMRKFERANAEHFAISTDRCPSPTQKRR